MSDYYTVNQICESIDTVSIDQAILYHVHKFQDKKRKDAGFQPEKIAITNHADRKFNLAVTAFVSLSNGNA